MPEMPEVETIRRDLEEKVDGKRIKKVIIINPSYFKEVTPSHLIKALEGKKFSSFLRRAKYLILQVEGKSFLVIHFGMTGLLLYYLRPQKAEKHTQFIIEFEDSSQLHYQDMRRLGNIWLTEDFTTLEVIKELGPEPLSEEFTLERFKRELERRKRSKIKLLLMEQSFISGVGNVYANESLFRSGIHPERTAGSLEEKEIKTLYREINKVIEEAIEGRGSSVDTYRDLDGKRGLYEERLQVYGREGEPCLKCGSLIKMKKLGGRGTYYCQKCQK